MATENVSEKKYSIKEAAAELGLSVCYVRRMILKGRIQTTQVQIATNTFKHQIAESTLNEWRSSVSKRTHRSDGRGKYVMYATPAEYAAAMKLIGEGEIGVEVKRANKVKQIA